MQVRNIGSNQTEVRAADKLVLVSYETPVAYIDSAGLAHVSKEKYSRTTTKHVNQWLQSHNIGPEKTVLEDAYDVELVFDF